MVRLLYCIFLKMEYGTFTLHQMIAYTHLTLLRTLLEASMPLVIKIYFQAHSDQ